MGLVAFCSASCGGDEPTASASVECVDAQGKEACSAERTAVWCKQQLVENRPRTEQQAALCRSRTITTPPGVAKLYLKSTEVDTPLAPRDLRSPVKRAVETAVENRWAVRLKRAEQSEPKPPFVYVIYLLDREDPAVGGARSHPSETVCTAAIDAAVQRLEAARQDADVRCLPDRKA